METMKPFKNSSLNGWRDLDGSQKTKVKKYYRMGNLSSILYDNEWRTEKLRLKVKRQDRRCLIEQGHGELRGREPIYKES